MGCKTHLAHLPPARVIACKAPMWDTPGGANIGTSASLEAHMARRGLVPVGTFTASLFWEPGTGLLHLETCEGNHPMRFRRYDVDSGGFAFALCKAEGDLEAMWEIWEDTLLIHQQGQLAL